MEEKFPATPVPESASLAGEETPIEESSFGDILSQFEQEHGRQRSNEYGQTVDAVVISVTPEAAYLDVGRKHEGILPLEGSKLSIKPGDHAQVTITGRDTNGYYLLTTVKVYTPVDWSGLEKAFADKATITGTVVETVKGGLRVDVGVRAFMPASRSGAREIPEMEKLVGQQIECRITKLDTTKEDVVVDRRVVLEEQEAKTKRAAFEALSEGSVVTGTVRNVTDFGAFVDLGGFDGLLHVAEMTYSRGAKPSDIVKTGDQIQVKILKINRETRKISLGMKQLAPDPWSAAASTFETGQRVSGKVVRLTDFGAFVELLPGVEGLIHVTEMSWSRKQKKPSDIVKVGDSVDVIVLGVNPAERRIALGLKQVVGDPWEIAVKNHPVGSVVEAPVSSITNFGAFVELGEGVDGMIHIGDITRAKRLEHPKEVLAAGQQIRAKVTEIDQERRRFRLSIKELEPTNADTYISEHQVGDSVTGRITELNESRARVELAEGVTGSCRLPKPAAAASTAARSGGGGPADVSALSAMLSAKWKGGGSFADSSSSSGPESMRIGQVRSFRIAALDAEQKRIDLEPAS
jgi:small subunit ribosomal protein S1